MKHYRALARTSEPQLVSLIGFAILLALVLRQVRPYVSLLGANCQALRSQLESGQIQTSETLKLLIGAVLLAALVLGIIAIAIKNQANKAASAINQDPGF